MARLALLLSFVLLFLLVCALSTDSVEGSDSATSNAAYARSQQGARQGSLRATRQALARSAIMAIWPPPWNQNPYEIYVTPFHLECPSACAYRCSKASGHKACMFFCNKCCAKCLCVPPGTYGNKQVCPCYNDWKTQQGGPKCP